MPITTSFANAYKVDLLTRGSADTYKAALYSSAASLDSTTAAYSVTNEITGTGYTAGGNTLSGTTIGSTTSTAWITWSNTSWTTATFTAAGAQLYNSTRTNVTIGVFDFGGNQSVAAGTFNLNFPAAAAATAVVRLT